MQFARFPALKSNALLHFMVQIWRTPETIEYILHKYLHWSSYTAEKKGVVIAFGSMYGNTRDIAQQLAKQLSKRGVTDIKIYDVSKTNPSYIIADAWKYTNLVTNCTNL